MNIAVITGASSGIGKEFALLLDRERLDEIWVIARRRDRLEALKNGLKTPVRVFALDITDSKQLETYRNTLYELQPKIRFLVCAAGVGIFGNYAEVDNKDVERMVDLNAKATVWVTNLSIPYMKYESHIIEIASSAGFAPLSGMSVYAASKAFLQSYSRALRLELAQQGIHVTAVCPGWVRTEFFLHTNLQNAAHAPKNYHPIYMPKQIASKALFDAKMGKALSIYGVNMKIYYALSRILPQGAMAALMQFYMNLPL